MDHVHIYFDMKKGEYFILNALGCAETYPGPGTITTAEKAAVASSPWSSPFPAPELAEQIFQLF